MSLKPVDWQTRCPNGLPGRMPRRCISATALLLVLAACVHDRSASRGTALEPVAAETPAPGTVTSSAPSSAPPPTVPSATVASAPAAAPSSGPAQAPPASVPPEAAAPAAAVTPAAVPQAAPTGAPATGSAPATSSPTRNPSGPTATKASPPSPAAPTRTPPAASAAVPASAATAASQSSPGSGTATSTLDLNALEQRLRDTHAIGLFTKLSLKNQVDDLLAQFKAFHQGRSVVTLAQLRQKYEQLLLKVVSLLQDNDPSLASAVSSSREAIWGILTDPKTFANI